MIDNKEYFGRDIVVSKLISGDKDLLAKFVNRYDKQLRNAALGMGFFEEKADDLVQTTWISFFESVKRFQKRSHIRTFLFGILMNKAREIWKKRGRETYFDTDESLQEVIDKYTDECNNCNYCTCLLGPEKDLNAKQLLLELDNSFKDMDERYSRIFYDRFVDGKDIKELCKENNISESNLGVIIHRVRKKLNKEISNK